MAWLRPGGCVQVLEPREDVRPCWPRPSRVGAWGGREALEGRLGLDQEEGCGVAARRHLAGTKVDGLPKVDGLQKVAGWSKVDRLPKVDGFVPHAQTVNLRMVRQPDWGTAAEKMHFPHIAYTAFLVHTPLVRKRRRKIQYLNHND